MPCASRPASLTTTLGATAEPFSESSSIIFSFVSDIISYDERVRSLSEAPRCPSAPFPQRKQPDEKQERERGRKVREEEQTVDSLASKASVGGRRAALFYNHLDAVRVEWRTRDALALSPVRSLSTMCAQISHRFGSTRRRKILLALQPPVQAALTSASTVPDIFSRITSLQNSTSKFSEVSFCSFFRSKNVREIRENRSNEPSFSRSTSQVNNHERCLINARRHSCAHIFGGEGRVYLMKQHFSRTRDAG